MENFYHFCFSQLSPIHYDDQQIKSNQKLIPNLSERVLDIHSFENYVKSSELSDLNSTQSCQISVNQSTRDEEEFINFQDGFDQLEQQSDSLDQLNNQDIKNQKFMLLNIDPKIQRKIHIEEQKQYLDQKHFLLKEYSKQPNKLPFKKDNFQISTFNLDNKNHLLFKQSKLQKNCKIIEKIQKYDQIFSNEDFSKVPLPGCSCKKSQCLKLYCECFQNQEFCNSSCKCLNCNNHENQQESRSNAISTILNKNQLSFTVKKQGCSCKKSFCQKKYCECFSIGLKCNKYCKCQNCLNIKKKTKNLLLLQN